jgi:hypothetical protein
VLGGTTAASCSGVQEGQANPGGRRERVLRAVRKSYTISSRAIICGLACCDITVDVDFKNAIRCIHPHSHSRSVTPSPSSYLFKRLSVVMRFPTGIPARICCSHPTKPFISEPF